MKRTRTKIPFEQMTREGTNSYSLSGVNECLTGVKSVLIRYSILLAVLICRERSVT